VPGNLQGAVMIPCLTCSAWHDTVPAAPTDCTRASVAHSAPPVFYGYRFPSLRTFAALALPASLGEPREQKPEPPRAEIDATQASNFAYEIVRAEAKVRHCWPREEHTLVDFRICFVFYC
jgi:hypothetical protein